MKVQLIRNFPTNSHGYILDQSKWLDKTVILSNELRKHIPIYSNFLFNFLLTSKTKNLQIRQLNKLGVLVSRFFLKKIFNKSSIILIPFATEWFFFRKILDYNKKIVVQFLGIDASKILHDKEYTSELLKYSSKVELIFLSRTMKSRVFKRLNLKNEKIKYKIKVLDIDKTSLDYKKRKINSEIKFLFAGRFTGKKSPMNLIKSFELLSTTNSLKHKISLTMIGEGPLLVSSKKYSISKNLDIKFIKSLELNKLKKLLYDFHVYVQHSVDFDGDKEGWPVIIAQAALSGMPIISTNHEGIIDQVKNYDTGFLVDENDFVSFSKKMEYFILNPNKIHTMGKRSSDFMKSSINKHSIKSYILG